MLVKAMNEEGMSMSKKSTPSHKAFGSFVKNAVPVNSTDLQKIGFIQESAHIYNKNSSDKEEISDDEDNWEYETRKIWKIIDSDFTWSESDVEQFEVEKVMT